MLASLDPSWSHNIYGDSKTLTCVRPDHQRSWRLCKPDGSYPLVRMISSMHTFVTIVAIVSAHDLEKDPYDEAIRRHYSPHITHYTARAGESSDFLLDNITFNTEGGHSVTFHDLQIIVGFFDPNGCIITSCSSRRFSVLTYRTARKRGIPFGCDEPILMHLSAIPAHPYDEHLIDSSDEIGAPP